MKQIALLLLCVFSLVASCASCDKDTAAHGAGKSPYNNSNSTGGKMRIKVGHSTFTATLHDNATAAAFKALLPTTFTMAELSNEKYFEFSAGLPVNVSNAETIQDGSRTPVLFCKTFLTSYSFTRLGKIGDPNGLAETLGTGDVNVKLDLKR